MCLRVVPRIIGENPCDMVSRPRYVVTTAFGTVALLILWFESVLVVLLLRGAAPGAGIVLRPLTPGEPTAKKGPGRRSDTPGNRLVALFPQQG